MMVWSLLAAPPLDMIGSYFDFVPLFWSDFQLYQLWYFLWFVLGICLPVLKENQVFLWIKVQMGWPVLDFLVRWSSLLSHGLLQWQRKFLEYWCSPEIIPLYLQYVLLLCWKCRLYNTGSVQLPVLSNSLVPRAGPMCAFSWVFNELWTWYLMAPKVLCWSQSCSPSSRALKYLGCVFKAWAFSTWSVLDLGVYSICALWISCHSQLYLRQNCS